MIHTENIIQSTILVSNGEDQEFQITAQVTKSAVQTDMTGGPTQHGQITNGKVRKDGVALATFTCYKNISISYLMADAAEQADVLYAVQSFCTEIKEYVDKSVINVLTEEEEQ